MQVYHRLSHHIRKYFLAPLKQLQPFWRFIGRQEVSSCTETWDSLPTWRGRTLDPATDICPVFGEVNPPETEQVYRCQTGCLLPTAG